MNRALLNRRLRQLHLWLGLAIGAQVGLWLISGLFMTWFPIENVRGEHLRASAPTPEIVWSHYNVALADVVTLAAKPVEQATATVLNGKPVWRVETDSGTVLIDAIAGEVISPLNESTARSIAFSSYAGAGQIISAEFLQVPPQEYGRAGPVWQISFSAPDKATFYVDPQTGEVKAVRTMLWRTFDFMWGLHIMDWSSRENFNSWWIRMTASLAVVFFLAGLGLALLRITNMLARRN
ncbi:PepSY domain-containing protein [Parvularcula sp. IMCC14364]|uniref:PepSY domain-containing protein n=1 Tax=Parvularcula sp. IMCC14364 TaxID=3067902 RepID=UPI002740731E|nr:PepSY domain-containing protein [Parvularcula sp. IMCC14364]